uniref:Uncharacterized protein n=1 Tax=Anguilla anguilla TaxID=7936 RepID=A0A0E9RQD2_ANGAN
MKNYFFSELAPVATEENNLLAQEISGVNQPIVFTALKIPWESFKENSECFKRELKQLLFAHVHPVPVQTYKKAFICMLFIFSHISSKVRKDQCLSNVTALHIFCILFDTGISF